MKARTAFPNARDKADAERARKERPDRPARGPEPSASTSSADPQLDGMDAEGARDPAYRAAYRVCMRRNGF